MSGPLDECPVIIVNGEQRKLGLVKPSFTTALPSYGLMGPMWSKEQIIDTITSSDWVPAEQEFGDSWIKDQDGIGACAGYAAASALERARYRRGLKYVELSGDAAYAQVNRGRDQGSGLEENMIAIRDNGIPPASLVPKWEYRKNRIPATAWKAGERFKGFELFAVANEAEATSALANKFALVVAVQAGNGGRSPDGLIDWSNGVGNHCVVVDDLRLKQDTFEYQAANSWKITWGQRGRGWLRWANHFKTSIKYHRFYAIRSTMDDPEGDNPPAPKED